MTHLLRLRNTRSMLKESEAQVQVWKNLCAELGDSYIAGVEWGRKEAIRDCITVVESIGILKDPSGMRLAAPLLALIGHMSY